VSARTKPGLLGHRATIGKDGDVLVDGAPWRSPEVAAAIEAAAGPRARLVRASGNERFDILPLLVATDGAIEAFGHDPRRLRPNIVVAGVAGLAERGWQWTQLHAGDAVIALADLRERCIMTTWDPDSLEQDVDVFRRIRTQFGGTLALNAWAAHEGVVAVGDAVRVASSRSNPSFPRPDDSDDEARPAVRRNASRRLSPPEPGPGRPTAAQPAVATSTADSIAHRAAPAEALTAGPQEARSLAATCFGSPPAILHAPHASEPRIAGSAIVTSRVRETLPAGRTRRSPSPSSARESFRRPG
jgi:hypothetical protein